MDSLLPHDGLAGAVLEKHLSVKAAAGAFGYNQQYLRRLLRAGRLQGTRIGQIWLIKLTSLEAHQRKAQLSRDQRYGPQGVPVDFAKGGGGMKRQRNWSNVLLWAIYLALLVVLLPHTAWAFGRFKGKGSCPGRDHDPLDVQPANGRRRVAPVIAPERSGCVVTTASRKQDGTTDLPPFFFPKPKPTLPHPPAGLTDDRIQRRQIGHLAVQAWLPKAPERSLLSHQHIIQSGRVSRVFDNWPPYRQ